MKIKKEERSLTKKLCDKSKIMVVATRMLLLMEMIRRGLPSGYIVILETISLVNGLDYVPMEGI